MAGADGNEGLLKGEAPFREKGCWGGCLGSMAPGAEGGPENNRVACFAPEMTRVLGAGRPVRSALTTPSGRVAFDYCDGGAGRTGNRRKRRAPTPRSNVNVRGATRCGVGQPNKKPMSREVCVEEEKAQSWTQEATINFAPCSCLGAGCGLRAAVWFWVWVWGRKGRARLDRPMTDVQIWSRTPARPQMEPD